MADDGRGAGKRGPRDGPGVRSGGGGAGGAGVRAGGAAWRHRPGRLPAPGQPSGPVLARPPPRRRPAPQVSLERMQPAALPELRGIKRAAAGCCVPLPAPAWLLNRSICAPGRLLCSLACPHRGGARCLQACGCLAERENFRLSRAWLRRPTLASILPCLQWLQAYKFREFLPVRLCTSIL